MDEVLCDNWSNVMLCDNWGYKILIMYWGIKFLNLCVRGEIFFFVGLFFVWFNFFGFIVMFNKGVSV